MDEIVISEKNTLEIDGQIIDLSKLIYTIRGKQVMLDSDLAIIYGYEVKRLNEQVKNNIKRFPDDFMFQMTREEVKDLRSKFSTANINSKSRSLPHVFTEQGIYMLATVLNGEIAENQSIFIMRAFREMRHFIMNNERMFERINSFNAQYPALTVKRTTAFHDRFLIIDGADGYHIGASLKDAGKKCFGINKIEGADVIKDIMKKAQQTGT